MNCYLVSLVVYGFGKDPKSKGVTMIFYAHNYELLYAEIEKKFGRSADFYIKNIWTDS